MTSKRTLILSAMYPEALAIARGLNLAPLPHQRPAAAKSPCMWASSSPPKRPAAQVQKETQEDADASTGEFTLINVGISATHLLRAQTFLDDHPGEFDLLVLAGIAGGLHPSLKIADIIVQWPPSSRTPTPSPHYKIAPITTATELIATAADKAALHAKTGALAVEMEAALIAPLAAQYNLPFLHIRSISDDHGDEFDPAFLPLLDPEGKPRLSRAMKLLARHPSKLKPMLHLQKTTNAALRLTETLPRILADYRRSCPCSAR